MDCGYSGLSVDCDYLTLLWWTVCGVDFGGLWWTVVGYCVLCGTVVTVDSLSG